jgi:hypothetical protein
MLPTRGAFGINKFKQYGNWRPYFKWFRNSAFFYLIFEIFDFQNDGFMFVTLCIWHRCFQMQIPFPGNAIKMRGSWRFPKKKLLSIQEPKK